MVLCPSKHRPSVFLDLFPYLGVQVAQGQACSSEEVFRVSLELEQIISKLACVSLTGDHTDDMISHFYPMREECHLIGFEPFTPDPRDGAPLMRLEAGSCSSNQGRPADFAMLIVSISMVLSPSRGSSDPGVWGGVSIEALELAS